ncbi:MAG: HmuY family protein, partial [Pseudomonadota bacterium]|nr:HmuY family protein [Pseudomonadota bacterium]
MKFITITKLTAITTMMSVLAACNGGSSGSNSVSGGGTEGDGTPSSPTSYRIDASDSDVFTYLNFSNLDAPLGLSEVEAHKSFAWDIAFRRTRIILNGGDSGPGFITGALADAQDEFYDENEVPIVDVFINATPEINGEEAFNQDFETSTLTFIEDQIQPAIDDWYQLNTQTISFEADSEQHWIVRSGNGRSYAKFNIVDIENLVDLENSEFALNTL